MSVVARKRKKTTTYYVVFAWNGKDVWERSGTDKRKAEGLERQRRAEVKAGTYGAPVGGTATTLGQYAKDWAAGRTTRMAKYDRDCVAQHIIARTWLSSMAMADVKPRHILQLVNELKATPSKARKGEMLAEKSVTYMHGLVSTMYRDAVFNEVVSVSPCTLLRGTLSTRVARPRAPYTLAAVQSLLTSPKLPPDAIIFNALAFFTGCREGEVCGRRWRDWDRSPKPLGSLTVATQYQDQPLKTDDLKSDHPRTVPVHAELARMLAAWWAGGFELVYCRKPTPDDFIVPHRKTMVAHTKSSAYKMWRRSCDAAGVENRTLHSTRHTFISLARRGSPHMKEVVEKITHNAKGDTLDGYTHWDWAPLCEVVSSIGLDANLDGGALASGNRPETPGALLEVEPLDSDKQGESAPIGSIMTLTDFADLLGVGPEPDARQALAPLHKAAISHAVQRAQWDSFDLMWAESLGIAIGAGR